MQRVRVANSSEQNAACGESMRLCNVAVTRTLKEISPGYFVIADSGCRFGKSHCACFGAGLG